MRGVGAAGGRARGEDDDAVGDGAHLRLGAVGSGRDPVDAGVPLQGGTDGERTFGRSGAGRVRGGRDHRPGEPGMLRFAFDNGRQEGRADEHGVGSSGIVALGRSTMLASGVAGTRPETARASRAQTGTRRTKDARGGASGCGHVITP
jgi:hypothetical protein